MAHGTARAPRTDPVDRAADSMSGGGLRGSGMWFHQRVEGGVRTRRVVHVVRALAVGHLFVSATAIIMVVVALITGTRPEAELEGLYFLFGLVLAIPTAAFTGAAVRCVRLSFREPPEGLAWSAVLGATEAALGVAFGDGVAVSGAPLSSPLILPAVILLVLGLMTMWLTVVRARRTHRSAGLS